MKPLLKSPRAVEEEVEERGESTDEEPVPKCVACQKR